MSSQPVDPLAFRSARAEMVLRGTAYSTLVLGYLLSVLLADHLTLGAFLAFTTVQVLYALGLGLVMRSVWTRYRSALSLYALFFAALSIASGFIAVFGFYWDWLLYLVTVVMFFSLLSLRSAVISSVLLYGVAVFNVAFLNRWQVSLVLFSNGVSVLAAFVFVGAFALVMALLEAQKERAERLLQEVAQSKMQLEEAHRQLRLYAEEVEELAVARERTRVAREIHDTLGHYLTILNVQLETISKLVERDPSRLAAEIAEARQVAGQAMQEVRVAVSAMRPAGIATLSLAQALSQLETEFKLATLETELTLDLEAELPALAADVQVTLYRAVQEALTNVRKHAQASKVLVRLRYEEGWLDLLVLDNGVGTAAATASDGQRAGGFGLIGLGERVKLLGGQVTFGSAPSGGYRVTVRIQPHATQQEQTFASLEAVQGAR